MGRHQETLITSLPDHEVPQRFDEYGYGMVVADGVGGTGTGEAASRLAIATLTHLVIYFGRWNLRIDDEIAREVMARAERFYRRVDSVLLHRSAGTPGLRTTLTAAYSAGRDLFLVHVGHSRAYLLRGGQLSRLTRDHTLADEPATGMGPLVDIATSARDLHHILTETIGSTDLAGPMIDIDRLTWRTETLSSCARTASRTWSERIESPASSRPIARAPSSARRSSVSPLEREETMT